MRSYVSRNDYRYICSQFHFTSKARAGPREQPNNWAIFYILREFADIVSKFIADLGFFNQMHFGSSIPDASASVNSRFRRIDHILPKEVDATLDQNVTAGLIQPSSSPYSMTLVVGTRKPVGVRIIVSYKNLNLICNHSQSAILRVTRSSTRWARNGCCPRSTCFVGSIRLPCKRTPFLSRRAYKSGSSCPRGAVLPRVLRRGYRSGYDGLGAGGGQAQQCDFLRLQPDGSRPCNAGTLRASVQA